MRPAVKKIAGVGERGYDRRSMAAQVGSRWLARAISFVDRFVPPAILAAPEPARRARFAVALSWISAALFVLALGIQGPMNTRGVFLLNLVSAVGSAVAPFVLRRTGRTSMVCNAVLALSFVKYLVIIAFWRGAGLTGATVLLSQLPLAATFLMGLRAGAVWAVLSTVAGVAVALLGRAGLIVDHLPPGERLFNDHFVLVISTAILFTIAWLYEHMKDAAHRQIYALEASRQAAELERVQAVSRSQLAEAQRLASLGRIAAATAHEINSPLLAVVANLEHAVEHLPARAPADFEAAVRESLDAAQRIGAIVADMNRYAQPADSDGTFDVAEAIAAALALAQPHTRARARVAQRIGIDVPRVRGDSARLTEVLLNLVVNAAEAIPEGRKSANEIVVEARASDRDVIVEVSEPITGYESLRFGLAQCEGIVASLGGTLAVESGVVRLTLIATGHAPVPTGVRLDILVIDDDEAILSTLRRVLAAHTVTIAAGGRAGLDILATHDFDLILCDLMMPDLTGMDLFDKLAAPHAERIVFMTGGTFTERAEAFRRGVPNAFLEKPFDLRTLRRLVDARAAAPHRAVSPPSTTNSAPVTNVDSSLAR